MEKVNSYKYLGIRISEDLSWQTCLHTSEEGKAASVLTRAAEEEISMPLQKTFTTTIASVLSVSITATHGNWSSHRLMQCAEHIARTSVSNLQDIYIRQRKAGQIIKNILSPQPQTVRLAVLWKNAPLFQDQD